MIKQPPLLQLATIKQKLALSNQDVLSYLNITLIPISIFKTKLPPLQSLVKYLKEDLNFNYKKTSTKLNRNYQTIRTTYLQTKKIKLRTKSRFFIPLSSFKKDKFSILETVASYLKEQQELTFHEIATLLNKDDRTIWTCYDRYKKKELKNN